MEENGHDLFNEHPKICLEILKETTQNVSEDSRVAGRYLNRKRTQA